jgi:protein-S-isoprenylcysteine O-methyltransferase Ste14
MIFDKMMLIMLSGLFVYRLKTNWGIIFSSIGSILDLLVIPLSIITFLLFSKKPKDNKITPTAILGVVLSFSSPFFLEHTKSQQPLYLGILAIGTCLFYSSFLFYSYITIGRNLGVFPGERDIVKHGPFGLIRHPIYAAYFHLCLCYVIIFPSIRNIICNLILFAGLVIRATQEESLLSSRSDYRDHLQKVKRRFFNINLSFPLIILLLVAGLNIKASEQINAPVIHMPIAYPVTSLNPIVYDDWGAVFVGNHIYRRFLQEPEHPELPFIAHDVRVLCSNGSADISDENCSQLKLTFQFEEFYSCNGLKYTIEDIKNELNQILSAKTWILPDWNFCEALNNNQVCIEAKNGKDLYRRLRSIYSRFGWSKSSINDTLYGAGNYCLTVEQRDKDVILKGVLSEFSGEKGLKPVLNFWTSSDKNDNFTVALYGSNELVMKKRRNLHVQTPTGYYLVTHKQHVRTNVPWNSDTVKNLLTDHLAKNGLTSYKQSDYLLKLLPKGNAAEDKTFNNFDKNAAAELVLPDYFPNCQPLSKTINEVFIAMGYNKLKAVCQDLSVFQKSHVSPVSGDGKFDAFVSPLSPGAAGPNAIRYQYFSPLSKESYTSDYGNPEELFYLLGIGPSYVTVDGETVCDIKPNSMGLSNIMVTDFIKCDN